MDLNAGDDTLQANNIAVDDFIITMDEGADLVQLGAFEAFATDPGGITTADGSIGVSGLLLIDTGTGADLVRSCACSARRIGTSIWATAMERTTTTTSRLENDFAVTLDDQLYVFIGSGETIDIDGGSGDDLVNINYLTANGALVVDGVTGNDVISVNGSVFNEYVGLFGGSGFDTIAVDFCRHDGGAEATWKSTPAPTTTLFCLRDRLVEEGQCRIRCRQRF